MVFNDTKKGQESTLILFGIILMGFGVGMLSYAQMSAVPGIMQETMDDVPMVVEAKTQSDLISNHYIPVSAHYAVAQGVWSESQNVEYIKSNGGFTGDTHYKWTIDNATEEAKDYFNDEYIGSDQEFVLGDCRVFVPDKEVKISLNSETISVKNDDPNDNFVKTKCRNRYNEVVNVMESASKKVNTSTIRLHKILLITLNGTEAVQDEANNIESSNDHYDRITKTTACMSSQSNAKDAAKNALETKAYNEIFDVQDDIKEHYDNTISSMSSTASPNLLGRVIQLVNPWSPDPDQFDWGIEVHDNSTHVSQVGSASSSKCGCEGSWSCSNSDLVPDTPVSYPSSYQCEYDGSYPSATCPGSQSPTAFGDCEWANGTVSSDDPTCSDSDLTHDGSGDCEWDGSLPQAQCSNWKYEGSAEYYYELDSIEFESNVSDSQFDIPTDSGWKPLQLIRRLDIDFSGENRP